MIEHLIDQEGADSVAVTSVAKADFPRWLARQPVAVRQWVDTVDFAAEAGEVCLIATGQGRLRRVLFGLGGNDDPWVFAALPAKLPPGSYRLDDLPTRTANWAATGWALAGYTFDRYKSRKKNGEAARLVWPRRADRAAVERIVEATTLVRDLINTPAADMGPEQLAGAAEALAARHGAAFVQIVGTDLRDQNYGAIHAVGRASARPPRLIDLHWGDPAAPRVTLVGKGVCFDTGGLDIKTAGFMKLMKKDMGGAAHVLGLAGMIMSAALPLRLRVLVPAVENSVSGDAFRPLDVLRTRKGLTVEVGNTDAEGRLVLADALAEADADQPALLIDCATLTGAARTALGVELPALFTNDDRLAADLMRHGAAESDPLWRLPLWKPYRRMLDSKVADLNNVSDGPHAGAITAALFLQEFVSPSTLWAHLDLFAWNNSSRPGRPEGGEAQTLRTLFALVAERFGR